MLHAPFQGDLASWRQAECLPCVSAWTHPPRWRNDCARRDGSTCAHDNSQDIVTLAQVLRLESESLSKTLRLVVRNVRGYDVGGQAQEPNDPAAGFSSVQSRHAAWSFWEQLPPVSAQTGWEYKHAASKFRCSCDALSLSSGAVLAGCMGLWSALGRPRAAAAFCCTAAASSTVLFSDSQNMQGTGKFRELAEQFLPRCRLRRMGSGRGSKSAPPLQFSEKPKHCLGKLEEQTVEGATCTLCVDGPPGCLAGPPEGFSHKSKRACLRRMLMDSEYLKALELPINPAASGQSAACGQAGISDLLIGECSHPRLESPKDAKLPERRYRLLDLAFCGPDVHSDFQGSEVQDSGDLLATATTWAAIGPNSLGQVTGAQGQETRSWMADRDILARTGENQQPQQKGRLYVRSPLVQRVVHWAEAKKPGRRGIAEEMSSSSSSE
eukprot:s7576_g5.t1